MAPLTHNRRPDHTWVLSTRKMGSQAYWEKAVPKVPGVAPISPTGLPANMVNGRFNYIRCQQGIAFTALPKTDHTVWHPSDMR